MKRATTTKTEVRGTLALGELEALVRRAVPDAPENAEIALCVDIPGGGDWSNESLDLLDHTVWFTVRWTTEAE